MDGVDAERPDAEALVELLPAPIGDGGLGHVCEVKELSHAGGCARNVERYTSCSVTASPRRLIDTRVLRASPPSR